MDIYTSKSTSIGANFEKYIYTGKRQFALYKKNLSKSIENLKYSTFQLQNHVSEKHANFFSDG